MSFSLFTFSLLPSIFALMSILSLLPLSFHPSIFILALSFGHLALSLLLSIFALMRRLSSFTLKFSFWALSLGFASEHFRSFAPFGHFYLCILP